jgi:hypothetical protein
MHDRIFQREKARRRKATIENEKKQNISRKRDDQRTNSEATIKQRVSRTKKVYFNFLIEFN